MSVWLLCVLRTIFIKHVHRRLPLNDLLHKEARIPNPWKLQVSLPSPCKYFLRMDLLKATTVLDIK